jgi:hypothetical protein
MAKVQGKKSVAGKKVAARKPAARAKSAKPAPKRPAKAAKAASKSKPVRKAVKKKVAAKPAAKPVAKPKVTAKGAAPAKATKPTRAAASASSATSQKNAKAAKPIKAKVLAKTTVKPSSKTVTATVAKVAGPAAAAVAKPPARVAPPVDEKKRRRPRPKVSSSGAATATWFSQGEKPRSSSFIPAPPRAEAPSLVAAPPASSDRLVSNDELTAFAVRTAPVRIDVEASAGRVSVRIFPDDVTLRIGEGIEWDFRYLGGADVIVDELIVEFEKPAPFTHSQFRSKRPGINRPHRQLSGPVLKNAAGKHFRYTVRAFNAFKTEQATAQPSVTVSV